MFYYLTCAYILNIHTYILSFFNVKPERILRVLKLRMLI